jgi:hypothetical protein
MVASQAFCTIVATSFWPMWTSIITAAWMRPEGLAKLRRAIAGAEPWIASNIAASRPMLAEPAIPIEPATCAATSERMSP